MFMVGEIMMQASHIQIINDRRGMDGITIE